MARRTGWVVLFFVALVPGLTAVFGQAAVQSAPHTNQPAAAVTADPVMPKDPNAAMLLAARVNGLGAPDMKPWHLKADYQTFDADGKPRDTGVFEEWWAGSEKYKISYMSNSFRQVLYRDSDKEWLTGDAQWAPFAETMVQGYLVHPLLGPREIRNEKYIAANEKVGGTTLRCIRSTRIGSPVICMAGELPVIRAEKYLSGQTILFNNIVRLDGHFVAERIEVANSDLRVANVNVTTLDGLSSIDSAQLTPPTEARLVPVKSDESGVVAGHWLSGIAPEYPGTAMKSSIDGAVVLSATITEMGKTEDVEVISGPAIFQNPAIEALKSWRFTPFLLDAKPVRVTTKFSVVFQHHHSFSTHEFPVRGSFDPRWVVR